MFWLSNINSLPSFTTSEVIVYVEDNKVGSMGNSGLLMAPNCGEGGVTYYLDLGTEKSKTISYSIKYTLQNSTTEYDYAGGTTKVEGGVCKQVMIQ